MNTCVFLNIIERFKLGNGGIRLGINYSVSNETK